MHLIQLDESGTVVKTYLSLAAPTLVRLDSSYMLSHSPAAVGCVFDPETNTFAPPPPPRHITRLALLTRIGMEDNVAIELASIHDPSQPKDSPENVMAATLRKMLQMVNSANWIDLDRPDTRGMVMQLEQFGLLAPGRALQILDGEITDIERPQADTPKAVEA